VLLLSGTGDAALRRRPISPAARQTDIKNKLIFIAVLDFSPMMVLFGPFQSYLELLVPVQYVWWQQTVPTTLAQSMQKLAYSCQYFSASISSALPQ
jgi:hypothetical protein